MSKEELEQYFLAKTFTTYERENYDKFLKKEGFQFNVPSIHITGTNGKGSVTNFLYNIYLFKGYKVGMFNSPYLNDVTEMLSINGKAIEFDVYEKLFSQYKEKFEKFNLSTFEMQTFLAFKLLQEANLDLCIIEVGMGGFIDATNIIQPILSIITSVSLEHTSYLGRSISEIASNKAGIIKSEVPALIGKLDETAVYAIRQRCQDTRSKLFVVDDFHNEKIIDGNYHFDYRPYNDLVINSLAEYQLINASLAIEATKIVTQFPVDEEAIRKGLLSQTLSCRFDFVKPNLLIDGAHNAEGIQKLVDSLTKSVSKPVHVVFASFRDKNFDLMINTLGTISEDITLTTFNHKRAREEMDYFLYLEEYKFNANYISVIKEKLEQYPDDLVLVTGSLAFAGVVKREIQ